MSSGSAWIVVDDLVPGDHDLRPVVLELVAQLARRVERVVLDDDRAEAQDRVERDDVLRAVRHDERDRVALAHPELAQALGGARDLVAQLGVGRLAAEELERDVVGYSSTDVVDQVDQRRLSAARCRRARPRRSDEIQGRLGS